MTLKGWSVETSSEGCASVRPPGLASPERIIIPLPEHLFSAFGAKQIPADAGLGLWNLHRHTESPGAVVIRQLPDNLFNFGLWL
jgi:hypothetical protein